ncbi:MAG TPA: phosphoenolpyruvate carboxylase, partial [Solibacterales bacterium]|nr:phosphoenolpyruvate carboxylase [Bryobacterales bacterium]
MGQNRKWGGRVTSYLRQGFDKWEQDLRFLIGRLQAVLAAIDQEELAALIQAAFLDAEPTQGPLPPRGAQALSIGFQLLNMVEENTANQTLRAREQAEGPESTAGSWAQSLRWLKSLGFTAEQVAAGLAKAHVQPVLTAHPTEAKRATVLEQHRDIYVLLLERERGPWSPIEHQSLLDRFDAAIERLWRTGEIFLERPDVASEVRNVMHYLTAVFPDAIQLLTDRFQHSWPLVFPETPPPAEPRLTFGSWVGGDRDGHPFVTVEVTRETLERLRGAALGVLRARIGRLAARLSLSERLQAPPAELTLRMA